MCANLALQHVPEGLSQCKCQADASQGVKTVNASEHSEAVQGLSNQPLITQTNLNRLTLASLSEALALLCLCHCQPLHD